MRRLLYRGYHHSYAPVFRISSRPFSQKNIGSKDSSRQHGHIRYRSSSVVVSATRWVSPSFSHSRFFSGTPVSIGIRTKTSGVPRFSTHRGRSFGVPKRRSSTNHSRCQSGPLTSFVSYGSSR